MLEVKIIDENNITVDGKPYKAINEIGNACKGCILESDIDNCWKVPCGKDERKDNKNVIFA